MPNIKAAEKWQRQTQKRAKRNLDTKTRLKTLFKKGVASSGPEAVASVESAFDKAAQKGVIHPNKAARKKARLARAVQAAAAQAAAAPVAPATRKRAKETPKATGRRLSQAETRARAAKKK